MIYQPHANYKDSGVEYLGMIPVHWDVRRVKDLSSIVNGYPFDSTLFHASEGHPLIRIRDLNKSEAETFYKGDFIKSAAITSDDVLIGMDGDFNVGRWLGAGTALLNQRMCCIRGFSDVLTRLLEFSLPTRLQMINDVTYSTTVKHLASSQIEKTFVSLPNDAAEQLEIAAFLDHETAKIDELAKSFDGLIATLREKRQAVISHAVTKGLDPSVPLKDSGIQWLGQLPAHWVILKGSSIGTLFGSEQVPEESVIDEGELPFIKVGSMSADSFAIESWDWFVDKAVAGRYKPRGGFIVFPKRGAAIFNNKVNIVDRPALIDPNLMGWDIGERAVTAFIAYALKARKIDELADVSTVPQINNKHVGPERFPIPPLPEQHQIVEFLNVELTKLDALIAETQRTTELLHERRTALISAAVTGKIDVRAHAIVHTPEVAA